MAKRKTRRRFSDEFKSETVKRVKQSRSMAALAIELDINAKSIGEWVDRAEESGSAIEEVEREATVRSMTRCNIFSRLRPGDDVDDTDGKAGPFVLREGGSLEKMEGGSITPRYRESSFEAPRLDPR